MKTPRRERMRGPVGRENIVGRGVSERGDVSDRIFNS